MSEKAKLDANVLQENLDGYKLGMNAKFIESMGNICRLVQQSGDENPISVQLLDAGRAVEGAYNEFLIPARVAGDAVEQYIELANYHSKIAQISGVSTRDTGFDAQAVDVSKATKRALN